ncbi:unnamed protein product, partial [Larinioides sclopetarius]
MKKLAYRSKNVALAIISMQHRMTFFGGYFVLKISKGSFKRKNCTVKTAKKIILQRKMKTCFTLNTLYFHVLCVSHILS